MGASDHAIALFVLDMVVSLGFLCFNTLICGLIVRINEQTCMFYICGCEAHFVIHLFTEFWSPSGVSVSVPTSRKRSCGVPGKPPQQHLAF